MSSSKKNKGEKKDFAAGFYLPEAQYPIPPPLTHCTVYVYIIYYSHREGELNQREGERGNSSQSWIENTNITDCISSL
jgi:hypothetical protein